MPTLVSTLVNEELGSLDNRLRELMDFISLALGGLEMREDGTIYKTDTEGTIEMAAFWAHAIGERCGLLATMCLEEKEKQAKEQGEERGT
jgi:hypothetical protein